MVPAQVMARAVPMDADTLAQLRYLCDELFTGHPLKIVVHPAPQKNV
jgi:hypothetical protein